MGSIRLGEVWQCGVCNCKGHGKLGQQLCKSKSIVKLVGKGKEIYSPDIENAKGKIRLSDIEPYAVQSVSEFDSCIEE